MFLLKKLLTQLVMPLPLSLAFVLLGLLLLWFTRKQRTGRILTTIGVLLLVLSSYGFLPDLLMGRLEKQNPPLVITPESRLTSNKPNAKWIVVLGSGNLSDPYVPGKTNLTASSLFRVVEGIRLYRTLPGSRLLLCGGPTSNFVPEAETMGQTARDLGVPPEDIVLEPSSMDTSEQAVRVKELVREDRFIVISSAFHLPRALALLRKVDLNPIPAAVDYHAGDGSLLPGMLFPQANNIRKMELGLHEHVGLLWYRMRGQSD